MLLAFLMCRTGASPLVALLPVHGHRLDSPAVDGGALHSPALDAMRASPRHAVATPPPSDRLAATLFAAPRATPPVPASHHTPATVQYSAPPTGQDGPVPPHDTLHDAGALFAPEPASTSTLFGAAHGVDSM